MPAAPRFFRRAGDFGAWLERHAATAPELLVGYWKVGGGKPSMTWAQSVEQALAHGWIDGRRHSLGPDAYSIRFTPRKPGSHWSAVNVRTARRLLAEGRMAPAGAAAFAARRKDRTAQASYEQRKAARFAGADLRRFKADPAAWAWFRTAAPSYRHACAWWVQSAKRPATRQRRLELVIHHAHMGETAPQWRWSKATAPERKDAHPKPSRARGR